MPVDRSRLRHPWEHPLFIIFAMLNVGVFVLAIWGFWQGAEWISQHPFLERYKNHIRALAIAIAVGPFLVSFLRNARAADRIGNSVPVSPQQLPELHAIFVDHCQRLGLAHIPSLYFSDQQHEASHAYSAWKKDYIVLGTSYMQPDLRPMLPVFSFLIGRELGALQLGHTTFGHDLLLSYVSKIPVLRVPLHRVFTLSEDRWGAYLAPDQSLQALVAMASGRRVFPRINVNEHLQHVRAYRGRWTTINEFVAETPTIASRILALDHAGLLSLDQPVSNASGGQKLAEARTK